ncbi:MAG: LemA family protein [Clostridia bacterium]|nr:LemA family protein [Clostridia bacterium]
MTGLIIALTTTGVIVFLIYNKLVTLRNMVEEAFSTMDVYLKKRWDLIPNLVAIVKNYANFEQEALERVVRARALTYSSMSMNDKLEADKNMADGVLKLVALGESYPNLTANENFIELAKELVKVEDEIAKSRKYYNGCVRVYNTKLQQFPNTLFAEAMGFKTWDMFAAEQNERKSIKVEI